MRILVILAGAVAALALVLWFNRWRQPPPSRTDPDDRVISPSRELERRRRAALGLADRDAWAAARRAVVRGTAAPDPLRPATRELAADRVVQLDDQLRAGRVRWPLSVAAGVALWCAAFFGGGHNVGGGVTVGVLFVGLSASTSPWALRRHRDRATRALAANS